MDAAPIVLATSIALLLSACTPAPDDHQRPLAEDTAGWEMHETYRVPSPLENVLDVMQAKLAHTHAVLEGIAIEDFSQIETNATQLAVLSEEAGFRVHATVAYTVFSDEFGATARRLGEHARGRDLQAVYRGYLELTRTCIRCHEYLRRERPKLQLPGAVSLGIRVTEDCDPG